MATLSVESQRGRQLELPSVTATRLGFDILLVAIRARKSHLEGFHFIEIIVG